MFSTPESSVSLPGPEIKRGKKRFSIFSIWLQILLLLILSCWVTLIAMNCMEIIQDDAFITFAYSRNLHDHNGLVFNRGEKVEGFTCLLWLLINAIPVFLKIDVVLFSKIIGYCSALLTLWLLYLYAYNFFRYTVIIFIPLLIFVFNDFTISLASGGMETGFFYFLLVLTNLRYALETKKHNFQRFPFSAFLAVSMVFTRPEGLIFSGCILLDLIITGFLPLLSRRNRPEPDDRRVLLSRRRRYFVTFCLVFFGGVFLFYGFRLFYFSDFYPNTYYIKSNVSLLSSVYKLRPSFIYYMIVNSRQWQLFFQESPLSIVYLLMVPCTLIGRRRHWNIFLTVLIGFIYINTIGPDFYMGNRTLKGVFGHNSTRFIIFFYPIILLGMGLGLDRLITIIRWKKKISRLLNLVIILGILTLTADYLKKKDFELLDIDKTWVNFNQLHPSPWWFIVQYMADYRNPVTILTGDIGYNMYALNCKLIDPVGLTDGNATRYLVKQDNPRRYLEVIREQEPDFIFDPGPRRPDNLQLILSCPEIMNNYDKVECGYFPPVYTIYRKKGFSARRRTLNEKIEHYEWLRTYLKRDRHTVHRLTSLYQVKSTGPDWTDDDLTGVRNILYDSGANLLLDRSTWKWWIPAFRWAFSITPRRDHREMERIAGLDSSGQSTFERISLLKGSYEVITDRLPDIQGSEPICFSITSPEFEAAVISDLIPVSPDRNLRIKAWVKAGSDIDCRLEVIFFNRPREELLVSNALIEGQDQGWNVLVFEGRTIPDSAFIETRLVISRRGDNGPRDNGRVCIGTISGEIEAPPGRGS